MNKIKQILRGHFEGHGSKQLSKLTGVSRNTIESYLKRFQQTGMLFEEANQLSDEGLAELILGPPSPLLKRQTGSFASFVAGNCQATL